MTREFTCDSCGELFDSNRSDDDAIAEMESVFGQVLEDDRAVVCETCWDKIKEKRAFDAG